MTVELSEEMVRCIEAERDRWYESPDPILETQIRGAKRHDALPLLVDMFYSYGITLDGEILRWSDEPRDPFFMRVVCPLTVRGILFQGAQRFPGLKALVPERPPAAIVCTHCRGLGPLAQMPDINCVCFGLGWYLPGEYSEA